MYVRLAFAVAAHLEPEILVVDEVLAVGDAEFQKKCLGKMSDISKEGRTVLFVSHNMSAVKRLCSKVACIIDGKMQQVGETDVVVSNYLDNGSSLMKEKMWLDDTAPGVNGINLRSVKVIDADNNSLDTIEIHKSIGIEIVIDASSRFSEYAIGVKVLNQDGQVVILTSSLVGKDRQLKKGVCRYKMLIPSNTLNVGVYSVTISADIPNLEVIFIEENVLKFCIVSSRVETAMYKPDVWKGCLSPEVVSWFVSPGDFET
jgi:lipopolysaccharide transport system ATP-binding protein